jgi:hypothetical protein
LITKTLGEFEQMQANHAAQAISLPASLPKISSNPVYLPLSSFTSATPDDKHPLIQEIRKLRLEKNQSEAEDKSSDLKFG